MSNIDYHETKIRELLIASCHSSVEAKEFFEARFSDTKLLAILFSIAASPDEIGGDAEMQAAYYLSQFPSKLLTPYEPKLLSMLPRTDELELGYSGHLALALGKTKSPEGKKLIASGLGDGTRYDAWLFKKALEQYSGSLA